MKRPDDPTPTLLNRRSLLAAAGALLPGAALARDFGPHASPTRYPEPDVVVLDKRFAPYKVGNTPIKRLHTGMMWAEGPAWHGAGKFLMMQWDGNKFQITNDWMGTQDPKLIRDLIEESSMKYAKEHNMPVRDCKS